jgi:hypothetical protein
MHFHYIIIRAQPPPQTPPPYVPGVIKFTILENTSSLIITMHFFLFPKYPEAEKIFHEIMYFHYIFNRAPGAIYLIILGSMQYYNQANNLTTWCPEVKKEDFSPTIQAAGGQGHEFNP